MGRARRTSAIREVTHSTCKAMREKPRCRGDEQSYGSFKATLRCIALLLVGTKRWKQTPTAKKAIVVSSSPCKLFCVRRRDGSNITAVARRRGRGKILAISNRIQASIKIKDQRTLHQRSIDRWETSKKNFSRRCKHTQLP